MKNVADTICEEVVSYEEEIFMPTMNDVHTRRI